MFHTALPWFHAPAAIDDTKPGHEKPWAHKIVGPFARRTLLRVILAPLPTVLVGHAKPRTPVPDSAIIWFYVLKSRPVPARVSVPCFTSSNLNLPARARPSWIIIPPWRNGPGENLAPLTNPGFLFKQIKLNRARTPEPLQSAMARHRRNDPKTLKVSKKTNIKTYARNLISKTNEKTIPN